MSRKQGIIIYFGIVVLGMMFLIPPFRYYYNEGHIVTQKVSRYKENSPIIVGKEEGGSAGYRLLFAPSYKLELGRNSDGTAYFYAHDARTVYLDSPRLLVQFALIAVFVGGLFIASRNSTSSVKEASTRI